MREIKFKAWDKKKKDFVFYPHGIQTTVMLDGSKVITIDYEDVEFLLPTGLKDKNGVDIFEGDILKGVIFTTLKDGTAADIDGLWVVAWHQDGCWVLQNKQAYECVGICNLIYGLCKFEIVGNIYENSELLREL